jgi:prepilin-type processing-associated H-X9-DG protein
MRRDHGWSLVELAVVLATVVLLSAVIMPSLRGAMEVARLTGCATTLRDIHVGLRAYAAAHLNRFPPFAFSDYRGNLPLSGHWGGACQPNDPAAFGRGGVEQVNLWALVAEGTLAPSRLACPGAPAQLRDGTASLFTHTFRQSTFCLRFPFSPDLFDEAPDLGRNRGPTILGIYAQAGGGQPVRVGMEYRTVPQVRADKRYRLSDAAACGDGVLDPRKDAILSDAFWRQDASEPAVASSDLRGWPVRWAWCHGERFNALYGDGAVRTVRDDGTVKTNTLPADPNALADDGLHYATYAERVWQFFDAAR